MRHLLDWLKLNAPDFIIIALLIGIFWLSFPAR
jgi:hypothetical protein